MTIKIPQGTLSTIYEISLNGVSVLDANYTGAVVVLDFDETEYINRAMTKNTPQTKFLGYLTPDETAGLELGNYKLIFAVTNETTTPEIYKEHTFYIEITERGDL